MTLPFDHLQRGGINALLECACRTDLAYSNADEDCLVADYNRKVELGLINVSEPSVLLKTTTRSPVKVDSAKSPPRRSPPKNPEAVKPNVTQSVSIEVADPAVKASTSRKSPKEES